MDAWLERTKGEVAPATLQRYESVATRFLESLAGKAEQDSAALTETEILRFRDGKPCGLASPR